MLNLDSVKKYLSGQPVLKAWLFGSYARGEETSSSDVDILVEFDKKERIGLLRYADIILHLEQILKKKVDLVSEGALYPDIKPYVDMDKILIYERGPKLVCG